MARIADLFEKLDPTSILAEVEKKVGEAEKNLIATAVILDGLYDAADTEEGSVSDEEIAMTERNYRAQRAYLNALRAKKNKADAVLKGKKLE